MKPLSLPAIAVLSLLCTGCPAQIPSASQYCDVPADGWNTADGREFRPFGEDSVPPRGKFDVILAVRNNTSFIYKELWLEVEQSDIYGVTRCDTVRMVIADDAGNYAGRGTYGLYETADTIARGFSVPAGWQLAVRHIMSPPDVDGVNNLGIIAVRSDMPR